MIEAINQENESEPEMIFDNVKIVEILGYVSARQIVEVPAYEPDPFMLSKPA